MTAPARPDGPLHLLVWDAPNLDMGLSELLGRQPRPAERPRFDAVARWLLTTAGDGEAEACVFTNVAPGSAPRISGWVKALRGFGYAVFAKPKVTTDSDVDDDILAHVQRRRDDGELARVVLASGDGAAFAEPLTVLAGGGVTVEVLGYTEEAGWAVGSDVLGFVDLEDVPNAFGTPCRGRAWTPCPPRARGCRRSARCGTCSRPDAGRRSDRRSASPGAGPDPHGTRSARGSVCG